MPALHARYEQAAAARRAAYEEPWPELILRLLETTRYQSLDQHVEVRIAAVLGVDPQIEARALARQQAAGVVTRHEERRVATGTLTVDTRTNPHALSQMRRHWAEVALARMAAPRPTDWLAYNLVSLSWSDYERVRSRLSEAFREVRTIVAASEPCEVAALVLGGSVRE